MVLKFFVGSWTNVKYFWGCREIQSDNTDDYFAFMTFPIGIEGTVKLSNE